MGGNDPQTDQGKKKSHRDEREKGTARASPAVSLGLTWLHLVLFGPSLCNDTRWDFEDKA